MSSSTSVALGKMPRSGLSPVRKGAKETLFSRSAGIGRSPSCARFGHHQASSVASSPSSRTAGRPHPGAVPGEVPREAGRGVNPFARRMFTSILAHS
ncbi:hypothetical protein ROTAS13_02168 [Roseomonas sp. TAS13]|nr:hypothetical protein ROTAS13_02168 [Roseomonas sp. TAS13]